MFPLVHSQKKLRSKERGPINQEGSWGMLQIRGEISSRVLIEISGLKVKPYETQGAERGLVSSCVGWERWCLALCASTLGCFFTTSVEVTMVPPWGGFSRYLPWKVVVLYSISQSTGTWKAFSSVQELKSDTTASSDELLLTEGPAPVLEQTVRALRWPLRTLLIAPQQGTTMTLTLAPLHHSPQWLWADCVDKGHRECLTWSQPSNSWLRK